MKLLGNRVLVSKIEEPKTEGFQTVDVQDSFVYKGRIEQLVFGHRMRVNDVDLDIGSIILFAKYSPDTHSIPINGKDLKFVEVEDILAVL